MISDGHNIRSAYTNKFMVSFESNFIIHNSERFNVRSIDDLFMIKTDSEEKLPKFINELTKNHRTIQFDFK